jgi:PPP family 3-phenylpropionic acid transporter
MPDRRTAASLAGFYFLYYGVIGIFLPFIPAYLRALGLSMTQVGALLALVPLLGLITPPIAGRIADRTGHPERVLRAVSVGAMLGFAPLLIARSFPALVLSLGAYAAFVACAVPLVDTLTLRHVAREGGSYSHVRLFGSAGFVLASASFGAFSRDIGIETVVVALALLALLAAWSSRIPPSPTVPPASEAPFTPSLDLGLFLAATCLHWIACAPYHGTFALLVSGRGLKPWVVGTSAAAGVVAEILVMAAYPRLTARLPPRRALRIAFLASAVRWWLTARATSPAAFVSLCLLHGLTFGAYYIAAVQFVASRVPDAARARGQAIFASVTFGLGGLLGYLASGALFDAVGGPRLFELAAGLELVAFAMTLPVGPPSAPPRIAG